MTHIFGLAYKILTGLRARLPISLVRVPEAITNNRFHTTTNPHIFYYEFRGLELFLCEVSTSFDFADISKFWFGFEKLCLPRKFIKLATA